MFASLIGNVPAGYNRGMSFKQIDDMFAKHGWTCTDTIFRDREGGLIDSENVMAAMPEDVTLDSLAAWGEDRMEQELKRQRLAGADSRGAAG